MSGPTNHRNGNRYSERTHLRATGSDFLVLSQANDSVSLPRFFPDPKSNRTTNRTQNPRKSPKSQYPRNFLQKFPNLSLKRPRQKIAPFPPKMASSKVLTSSNSQNSDPSRRSSSASSFPKPDRNNSGCSSRLGSSMTVEGILRNMYSSGSTAADSTLVDASITLLESTAAVSNADPQGNQSDSANGVGSAGGNVARSVEEVWREIVSGDRKEMAMKEEVGDEMMTLEDFLARNGVMEEEEESPEVKLQPERLSGGLYAFDPVPQSPFQMLDKVEGSIVGVGNGVEVMGSAGSVRGKRGRSVLLEPLDKAAQQRQRRMIKNRESAARSRERKQAYQVELEAMAVKLEEENEQLLRERAERMKEQLKQLMEKVIPVVEQRRPQRALRRVRSMQW